MMIFNRRDNNSLLWLFVVIQLANIYSTDVADVRLAPKDYSYSPKASRVRDLAGFFESMQKQSANPSLGDGRNLVISLSEAASKLRLLTDGFPLEIKCNRYVKLIDRPNIRTYATVNLLANEDKQFNEIEQDDANLISRLQNERSFDALGKSQTIIQSLESERDNMRSVFEPDVQNDLLDCINYYIYRHQRATVGLIGYVRKAKSKLNYNVVRESSSEMASKKYNELMEAIKAVEDKELSGKMMDDSSWLRQFSKMYDLVLENDFQLPKLIRDFVTNSKRLDRLKSLDLAIFRIEELKNTVIALEDNYSTDSLKTNADYRKLLILLFDIVQRFGEFLPDETKLLIEDSHRKKFLNELLEQRRVEGEKSEDSRREEELKVDVHTIDEVLPNTMEHGKEFQTIRVGSPDLLDLQQDIAVNNENGVAPVQDVKFPEVDGAAGEVDGIHSSNNCPKQDNEINLSPQSGWFGCKDLALDISSKLSLFKADATSFEQARSMAETLTRFLLNCLMRQDYLI